MTPKPPVLRYVFAKIWNKQSLIFLFFLALSATFWVFTTLNETHEEEFRIPIELRGQPENVVITSDLPASAQVTLRDKGISLLAYRYTRKFKAIGIDFATYANSAGHITIPAAELQKQAAAQLLGSTQLLSFKPDVLSFYYNYGQCKRVPVVLVGQVKAARLYALSTTKLSVDSVTVYASPERLDTITAAYLNPVDLRNLSDTTQMKISFAKVSGAKFVPASVTATFCVDRLVEKTVQVPVQQVNFPATKQLRTFPATVNVSFQVAMGLYRQITSENFVLVVNYEDLLKNRSTQLHLSLKTIPTGVSHVRISPQNVEYVIEEVAENDTDL